MRRAAAVATLVSVVVLAWSVVANAQGETHRVYLPHLRRDATPRPTDTPTPVPTPTRGIECGTAFYSGFEEDGVWQIGNNDFAKIVTERPHAGRRVLKVAPNKNGAVTVRGPWFPWNERGAVLSARLTVAWRGQSSDDDPWDDDMFMGIENPDAFGFGPSLNQLSNQHAGGSWNIAIEERNSWPLGAEWPRAFFEIFAVEDNDGRTSWWIDEVRVEACWQPQ